MEYGLSPEQLEALESRFRLSLAPSDDRALSLPAAHLLDAERSADYLARVAADIYETDAMTVAASMFAKRYAFMVTASGLYAMSAYNRSLDYAVENCRIESYRKGEAWLPKVRLSEWRVSRPDADNEEARNEWRDRAIRNLFADNLSRVWNALAKSVPVSKAVLWENTAIYVYWLYENEFLAGASDEQKARMQADYDYLVRKAPASLFGTSGNPLAKYDGPKRATAVSDKPIRVRKTCCYYYKLSDEPGDYCQTCPKLKHDADASL